MLERKLELEDKIEIEEKLKVPSLDELEELTPLNCGIIIQRWDATDLTHDSTKVIGSIDVYSIVNQSDKIKKRFVDLLMEFRDVVEKAGETVESAQLLVNPTRRTREEEMKWMENNKELLIKLAGKWIAVEGSNLIAADQDFDTVLEKTKASGIKIPFIIYLTEPTTDSTIGI
jgi:hypothetical protein